MSREWLDQNHPGWWVTYNNDPDAAADDLFGVPAFEDEGALDLNDDALNWRRVCEHYR